MKNLITLSLAVSILLFVSSVTNAQISVEPDDFAVGTNISNAFPGVTLSAVGSGGWSGSAGTDVFAVDPLAHPGPFNASTGSLVFGNDDEFPNVFREEGFIQMRADFTVPAVSVSLDIIGNNGSDFGELKAYDSGDTLIDSAFTAQLTTSVVETLTVNGPGIAYIMAGGTSGESTVGLDNMEVDITIEVDVDIKGGSCPNPFNPKSKGSVPVAIVGSGDYDVTNIDPDSIMLTPEGGPSVEVIEDQWVMEDSTQPGDYTDDCYDCFDADDPANFNCDLDPLIPGDDAYCGDEYPDLVVKVDVEALAEAIAAAGGASKGDCINVLLTGFTLDGNFIEGIDSILILKNIAAD